MFDSAPAKYGGDNLMAPWIALRDHFAARGIPVHTADRLPRYDDGVRKLYFAVSTLQRYRELARRPDVLLSTYIAMECPVVEPGPYRELPRARPYFRRVLTWSDPESLLPFTGQRVDCERFMWPQSFDRVHEDIWRNRDRRFLVMINANKLPRLYWQELYTARLRAVEFFQRYDEIDLYGPNWDRMPNRVGRSWLPPRFSRAYRVFWEFRQRNWPDPLYLAASRAHKGRAESKSETLGRYTFALCFENMVLKGWMTEKIFDCFFAGTVPVYWGAPDVLDWVPRECFIDMRDFRDFAHLRDHLHGLSPTAIENYREAAREYLRSTRFDPFRIGTWVERLRRYVELDAGLDDSRR